MAFPLKRQMIDDGTGFDAASTKTVTAGTRGPPAGFPPKHQPPGHKGAKMKPKHTKQYGLKC
jgi:hypothetical protein